MRSIARANGSGLSQIKKSQLVPYHLRRNKLKQHLNRLGLDGYTISGLKRLRQSPSTLITAALDSIKSEVVSQLGSRPTGKKDLSHASPTKPWRRSGEKYGSTSFRIEENPLQTDIRGLVPSLPSIVARVVEERGRLRSTDIDAGIDAGIEVLSPDFLAASELKLLKKSDYQIRDVNEWAAILMDPNMETALSRLQSSLDVNSERISTKPARIPLFVVLFLLNRKYIEESSLSRLLFYAWHILRSNSSYRTFESNQIFVLFARFLRHARRVWPEGIVNIAALLTTFIPRTPGHLDSLDFKNNVVRIYNSALHLLSVPTSRRPMLSYSYQERAQFNLLARMVRFNPPLRLNGTGFRAIIRVQLTRGKTPRERDWAELKSKSWPPWNEPRTRMDEEKGFEYGASRAYRTMKWMREAGYAYPKWERVARIFAGWDTDRSPTIQTRAILMRYPRRIERSEALLWAGRISATRTLQEAWACFLAYEDEQLEYHFYPYQAMFEKMIGEQRVLRSREKLFSPTEAQPGDGKETFPAPVSSMDALYLPSAPPTFDQLLQRMLNRGIRPRNRFLALLLRNSEDIPAAIRTFEACVDQKMTEDFLVPAPGISVRQQYLQDIEFAALMDVFCRTPMSRALANHFSPYYIANAAESLIRVPGLSWWRKSASKTAIIHSFVLAKYRHSADPHVWTSILMGIQRIHGSWSKDRPPPAFLFFDLLEQVLEQIKKESVAVSSEGFSYICRFMQQVAIDAQAAVSDVHRRTGMSRALVEDAHRALSTGSRILRSLFSSLVGQNVDGGPMYHLRLPPGDEDVVTAPPMPRVLVALDPMKCHHYLRALGLCGDHDGMLALARWLAEHLSELSHVVDEELGGRRRWRLLLVAFRVFLERPSEAPSKRIDGPQVQIPSARPEIVELVRQEIESMGERGGWPSDDEVKRYLAVGAVSGTGGRS